MLEIGEMVTMFALPIGLALGEMFAIGRRIGNWYLNSLQVLAYILIPGMYFTILAGWEDMPLNSFFSVAGGFWILLLALEFIPVKKGADQEKEIEIFFLIIRAAKIAQILIFIIFLASAWRLF